MTKVVDDRIAVGYEWSMHGMNCCVNAQCRTPGHAPAKRARGERVPMFRCAGCNWAYYCSRDCQGHDWNNGHKASCKKAQRRVEKNGTRLSPIIDARDIHFIGWLVQQYILELRPTLLSQQSKYRKKSGLPKSVPLVSVLDYTQFPYKVETISAPEAIKRAPDEAWDTLLVEARRLVDKDLLVLSIIPGAGRPYTWIGFGRTVAP
uniref:MYND-type domain-containing protein n=1 Tax=Moniliophthora roreri TaxID=221103 RepID=A0A0W0EVS1_MONRR